MGTSLDRKTLLVLIGGAVLIVAFGISELVIWKGVKYNTLDLDTPCPTINVTELPGNKFVFQKEM